MHVLAADVTASTRGQVACELQASSVMTSLSGVTVDCVPLLVFPLVVSVMLCGCCTLVIPWSHLSCTWVDFGWRLGWLLSHLGDNRHTLVVLLAGGRGCSGARFTCAALLPCGSVRGSRGTLFCGLRGAAWVAVSCSLLLIEFGCCSWSYKVESGHCRPLFAKFGSGHCATFGPDHV